MSDIAPIAISTPSRMAQASVAAYRKSAPEPSVPVVRTDDAVEVSPLATYLSKLKQNPIREDLVSRVKAEIEAGTYDTPDKLDKALDELVQDL